MHKMSPEVLNIISIIPMNTDTILGEKQIVCLNMFLMMLDYKISLKLNIHIAVKKKQLNSSV